MKTVYIYKNKKKKLVVNFYNIVMVSLIVSLVSKLHSYILLDNKGYPKNNI